MKGVRLGRDELIARFGISGRLAVRIGALMASNIEITEPLLEIAGPGSAIEKVLTHPRFLKEADSITSKVLSEIVAHVGAEEQLDVQRAGHVRIIGLAEEKLADAGFAQEARGAELATRPVEPTAAALIPEREARQLFSPAELARLKLDALAGADSATRISAIRKLRYAPISAAEKGGVYLQLLLDPASDVRSEALAALEALGFSRDASQALRESLSGAADERQIAFERLTAMFHRLSPAEKQVVLAVLTGGLRQFTDARSLQNILRLLTEAVPRIVEHREYVTEVIKGAVARMLANPEHLERPVRQLLLRLAEAAPEAAAQDMWQELDTISDANVRASLLTSIAESKPSDEKKKALAEVILKEVGQEKLREINRQRLGYTLIGLGEPVIAPLLETFAASAPREKLLLAPFLDALCVDFPIHPQHKVEVAEALLSTVRTGDRSARLVALKSRVFHDRAIPDRIRAQLARLIARDMGSYTLPDNIETCGDLLERLGGNSVAPLLELVRSNPRATPADRAIRILARITAFHKNELDDPAGVYAQLMKFLKGMIPDKAPSGGFFWAVGVLAAGDLAEQNEAREIAALLKSQLGKVPFHADILDALGYLAVSAKLEMPDKIDIAHLLSLLLAEHEGEQDEIARTVETSTGILYEFGPRAEFDSVALPVVVDAVRRICLSPATSDALRTQLIDRAIEVWDKVANWRVVWGPRSSEALAAALGEIGSMPALAMADRLRIARSLARDVKRISVVRALGALSKITEDDPRLHTILVEAGNTTLHHWMNVEIAREERAIVLQSVAAIAARTAADRSQAARRLRSDIVRHLLSVLREGHFWTQTPLEALRDSHGMPKDTVREIDAALKAAFAIART